MPSTGSNTLDGTRESPAYRTCGTALAVIATMPPAFAHPTADTAPNATVATSALTIQAPPALGNPGDASPASG